jgi:hypothetical protein
MLYAKTSLINNLGTFFFWEPQPSIGLETNYIAYFLVHKFTNAKNEEKNYAKI